MENKELVLADGNTGSLITSMPDLMCSYARQGSYTDSKINKVIDDIETMVDCLSNINMVYKLINIQHDDIFLTLADTGEIVSVNQLVKDSRELKKRKEEEH